MLLQSLTSPSPSDVANEPSPRGAVYAHHHVPPEVEYPEHAPRQQGIRGEGIRISVQSSGGSFQTRDIWHQSGASALWGTGAARSCHAAGQGNESIPGV